MSSDGRCAFCLLPNCNGQRHTNAATIYVYPTCDLCGIELLDLLELIESPELRHPSECEVCERTYDNQPSHLLEHFEHINSAINKFHCVQCDASYTENCKSEDSSSQPTFINDNRITHTLKHRIVMIQTKDACNDRLRHFHSARHKQASTRLFACRICESFQSSDRSVRNAHEVAEHKDPVTMLFNCLDCGKAQTTVYKLQSHMMQHRPERKQFVCIVCGKDFAERAQLKSHSLTHTTARPYECHECGKSYKQSTKLMLHLRSAHEGLRPYRCEQCDATFKECSDLRRHRRVHGGVEKTQQCTICSKRFYEPKVLRVHMRSHTVHGKEECFDAQQIDNS